MLQATLIATSLIIVYIMCTFIVGMGKGTIGIDTKNNHSDYMLVGATSLIVMFTHLLDVIQYITSFL